MDFLFADWLGTPAWFWLAFIGLVALLTAFDPANLTPFAPKGVAEPLALGAALVVWAYSGIESATVPAEVLRVCGLP